MVSVQCSWQDLVFDEEDSNISILNTINISLMFVLTTYPMDEISFVIDN